jgi:hypothetical protein
MVIEEAVEEKYAEAVASIFAKWCVVLSRQRLDDR